eukprot:312282-Chlamydomonas_euryale.AAC.1
MQPRAARQLAARIATHEAAKPGAASFRARASRALYEILGLSSPRRGVGSGAGMNAALAAAPPRTHCSRTNFCVGGRTFLYERDPATSRPAPPAPTAGQREPPHGNQGCTRPTCVALAVRT